uniref:Uncharacterized protein n=1 Tax=Solanum tuberosum TaxID=4113 RepID=M1AQY5_SOLTU
MWRIKPSPTRRSSGSQQKPTELLSFYKLKGYSASARADIFALKKEDVLRSLDGASKDADTTTFQLSMYQAKFQFVTP